MVTVDRIEIKRPNIKEQIAEFCKDFPPVKIALQDRDQTQKGQRLNRGHIIFGNGLRAQVPPGVIKDGNNGHINFERR